MKKAIQVVLDERLIEAADAEVKRNPVLSNRSQLVANLLAPFLPQNIQKRITENRQLAVTGGQE